MILYLNLLPQKEKNKIKLVKIYTLLRQELIFAVFLLCLLTTASFYLKTSIKVSAEKITTLFDAQQEKDKTIIAELTEMNQNIKELLKIQGGEKQISYKSKMLIALAQATTKGIRFTSLKWQPDNSLYLSGTYDSRETLLKFKTDLEKEFITITEFPIVNLLKQKDGGFILKGNIIWKPN